MIITDALKKLEQVDKLMNSKGFYLLCPNGCNSLEDVAERFIGAEWNKLTWNDLTYTKHYGKQSQHCCFITLGTTEKLYRIGYIDKVPFMSSHLDITRARLVLSNTVVLIGTDNIEKEHPSHNWQYEFEAERNCLAIKKLLNKISSHIDY